MPRQGSRPTKQKSLSIRIAERLQRLGDDLRPERRKPLASHWADVDLKTMRVVEWQEPRPPESTSAPLALDLFRRMPSSLATRRGLFSALSKEVVDVEGTTRVRLPIRDLLWQQNPHGFARVRLHRTDNEAMDLGFVLEYLETWLRTPEEREAFLADASALERVVGAWYKGSRAREAQPSVSTGWRWTSER